VQALLADLTEQGRYDADRYLKRMIAFLRNPDSHRDTYVEEWLRGFFERRARGVALRECGVTEKHLGGLVGPVAVLLFHHDDPALARATARKHRELTHRGPAMAAALDAVADVLLPVLANQVAPSREFAHLFRKSPAGSGILHRWEPEGSPWAPAVWRGRGLGTSLEERLVGIDEYAVCVVAELSPGATAQMVQITLTGHHAFRAIAGSGSTRFRRSPCSRSSAACRRGHGPLPSA
jgi:hypothetical protein